jgi:hypothetical protein
MAENINIKITVDTGGAKNSIGELKNNLEGVNNAQKNVVNSGTQLNTNLKNTSTNIKALPLANAVRGVDRLSNSFGNMKLGGIASGFGTLARAVSATPWGAAAVAVGAIAYKMGLFDGAIKAVTKEYNKFMKQFEDYSELQDKAIAGYGKEKVGLDELFNSLSDVTVQGEQRSMLIDEINKKYGDYLPNLLTEQSTNEDIAAAYDLVNEALIKKAVTQAKANALEVATTQLLKDRIEAQKALSKAEREAAKGISSTEQLNRVNKAVADAKQEIADLDAAYQEEVKKINKVSQDLEASLFTATTNGIKDRNKARVVGGNNARRQTQSQNKNTKNDAQKAEDEQLKIIQDRYVKEVDLINDNNLESLNLLKKKLTDGELKQEEYDNEILKLNIQTNSKLLEQNAKFILTDEEKKKMGAENEKQFLEILSDDKLKVNSAYYDSLIALAKSNDEKIKLQKEKEAEEEKLRKEAELAEEKRIYEQRLNSFEGEFILKKREIQLNDDLTEEERKTKLEEAELEFFRNKLSITELGSEEYFKLIQEITDKEVALNKDKNKKISDDNRETQKLSLEFAVASLSAISTFTDIAFEEKRRKAKEGSKEEEALARRQFQINKSLQLGTAVINGIQSILAITSVPDFTFGVQSALRIGAQVVLNAASIAKIAAQRFQPNASSASMPSTPTPAAGVGGGEAPTFTPTSFFGLGQTTQFNPQEQGPTRVYVTEGDISNTQNRVRVVENRARFG